MLFNLELDSARDLNLTSGKNLSLLDYPSSVAQAIECRLRTVQEEWFLDNTLGLPYFTQILTKTKDKGKLDTIFKNEILKIPDVKIDQFESAIDNTTREYTITNLVVKLNSEELLEV